MIRKVKLDGWTTAYGVPTGIVITTWRDTVHQVFVPCSIPQRDEFLKQHEEVKGRS
jgi:hypothetical protein